MTDEESRPQESLQSAVATAVADAIVKHEAPAAPPPVMGYPLTAGLKTAARASVGVVFTMLVMLGQDPTAFASIAAIVPVRYYAILLAAVTISGLIHNAWKYHKGSK